MSTIAKNESVWRREEVQTVTYSRTLEDDEIRRLIEDHARTELTHYSRDMKVEVDLEVDLDVGQVVRARVRVTETRYKSSEDEDDG